jgi:hypothetical protein
MTLPPYAPPPYPIPLDGHTHVVALPGFFAAHGLIVNNNGAVALSITSGRGETWTVQPGGQLVAALPETSQIYTFLSALADSSGATAQATFSPALPANGLGGSMGGSAATNAGAAPVAQAGTITRLTVVLGAPQSIQLAQPSTELRVTLLPGASASAHLMIQAATPEGQTLTLLPDVFVPVTLTSMAQLPMRLGQNLPAGTVVTFSNSRSNPISLYVGY